MRPHRQVENFLFMWGVHPQAIPDVLHYSKITEIVLLKDAMQYMETLKKTHPHYFEVK